MFGWRYTAQFTLKFKIKNHGGGDHSVDFSLCLLQNEAGPPLCAVRFHAGDR